jgi:hypothetical protein
MEKVRLAAKSAKRVFHFNGHWRLCRWVRTTQRRGKARIAGLFSIIAKQV